MQHLQPALFVQLEQRAAVVCTAAGRGADHVAVAQQRDRAIGLRTVRATGEEMQDRFRAVRRQLEHDAVAIAIGVAEIGRAVDISRRRRA